MKRKALQVIQDNRQNVQPGRGKHRNSEKDSRSGISKSSHLPRHPGGD